MSAGAAAGLSIAQARRSLAAELRAAGVESPELDARLLVGAVTALDLTGLTLQAARPLSADEAARLNGFSARRLQGEPVARILGVKEFWGLDFLLSPATLVPRPDTETLVQTGLALLPAATGGPPLRLADIGVGSGALLLALLSERRDAIGVGADLSHDALTVAAANARRFGLADRAGFVRCNYTDALAGPFDLIVSNPPYIASSEIGDLDAEVRRFDPMAALDGGADGLDAYRHLACAIPPLLRPRGAFALEVGHRQAEAVASLMETAGLAVIRPFARDLAGVPRVVSGRKETE